MILCMSIQINLCVFCKRKNDSLLKGKQWLLMTDDGEKIYIPDFYVNFDMIMNCVRKFNWKERK